MEYFFFIVIGWFLFMGLLAGILGALEDQGR